MDNISKWSELLFESLTELSKTLMGILPSLLGAIFILLFGWLMAKLTASIVTKLLKVSKFDKLADLINVSEYLKRGNIKKTPSELLGRFAYWMVMLLVLITTSETLGWEAVSKEIAKILSFLPILFSALMIFGIGVYFATMVRDFIKSAMKSLGMSIGNMISNLVFYLLIILITLTALEQSGVDTSILTSNLLIVMGSVLLAMAISYGFASHKIFSNILAGLFSKRMYRIGQVIEIDGVRGKVIDMSNIAITIQAEGEKVVIPTHEFMVNKVKIIDN